MGWDAARIGFTPAPWLQVLGGLGIVVYGLGVWWTFRENAFAATVVKIQESQRVIDTGPYAIIRHPMYASTFSIGIPHNSLPTFPRVETAPGMLGLSCVAVGRAVEPVTDLDEGELFGASWKGEGPFPSRASLLSHSPFMGCSLVHSTNICPKDLTRDIRGFFNSLLARATERNWQQLDLDSRIRRINCE
jgi:hypothetical protein